MPIPCFSCFLRSVMTTFGGKTLIGNWSEQRSLEEKENSIFRLTPAERLRHADTASRVMNHSENMCVACASSRCSRQLQGFPSKGVDRKVQLSQDAAGSGFEQQSNVMTRPNLGKLQTTLCAAVRTISRRTLGMQATRLRMSASSSPRCRPRTASTIRRLRWTRLTSHM